MARERQRPTEESRKTDYIEETKKSDLDGLLHYPHKN